MSCGPLGRQDVEGEVAGLTGVELGLEFAAAVDLEPFTGKVASFDQLVEHGAGGSGADAGGDLPTVHIFMRPTT